jgi:hypothetical protein
MHSQPSRSILDLSLRSRLLVGLLAAMGLLVFVAGASASSLSATVTPSTITVGKKFTLKVKGSSDGPRQAVQVFSQKASTSCAATSSLEFFRSYSSTRFRTYINPGPFSFTQHVTTSTVGNRRICAYLDKGPRTTPQLTAGAKYKVVLPRCTRTRRHNCTRH